MDPERGGQKNCGGSAHKPPYPHRKFSLVEMMLAAFLEHLWPKRKAKFETFKETFLKYREKGGPRPPWPPPAPKSAPGHFRFQVKYKI